MFKHLVREDLAILNRDFNRGLIGVQHLKTWKLNEIDHKSGLGLNHKVRKDSKCGGHTI